MSRKTILGCVLLAASVIVVAGCGGGKKAATTTTSTSSVEAMGPRPAQTKAVIRQNWESFFTGSTPSATRMSLLENGAQFTKELAAVNGSALTKQVTAQVTGVTLTGPGSAAVTYSLLLNGNPVLSNVKGTAVLVDGTWKVSVASFCQLAALEGAAPAACPKTG